jgi:hypothetical protein
MEVSGQLHSSAVSPLGKKHQVDWSRGWVGPTASLAIMDERKIYFLVMQLFTYNTLNSTL